MQDLIFLVGYMGSGKTTTGRLLARELGYSFIDLDDMVEAMNNSTIPEIFNTKGEAYFRNAEQSALHNLSGKKKLVVATGGGCPAFSDNMDWMNKNGCTVYLRCHPGVIFHRIAPEKRKRPLISNLEDVEIMEFLLESLKKRLPFYIKSDITVNAEDSPEKTCTLIKEKLEEKITSS